MIQVQRTSQKLTVLSSDSSESRFDLIYLQRFYTEISYDEYSSEYRYLSTGDVVQLSDKRNVIFHETSKECCMFHETTGHLVAVSIKTYPAGTRFLLCRDKMIKQHRSQLYPELIIMSGSETLRPTLPNTSLAGMTKPYSDMYTQNHFTNLEQEHSDFFHNLQSFTDSGHKPSSNVPERKAWTVQCNGPLPLVSQSLGPTQVLQDEQTSSDNVKDAVKDMKCQIHYIDRQLGKMQESMKELQVIPETTPKGKGMTGNHSLAWKQLWINETELAPIVQIQVANGRDTDHTTSKLSPHPIPSRQNPDESNGQ